MAFHCPGRAVGAKEIADRQSIPLRYLEQILQDLRRAKIVDAKRGPRGGYTLCQPPEAIRLSDVITAVDGPIETLFALDSAGTAAKTDVPGSVWGDLVGRVVDLYNGITLRDLVARAEAMGLDRISPTPAAQMYFI